MNARMDDRPGVQWSRFRVWAATHRRDTRGRINILARALCQTLDAYHENREKPVGPQLWHSCMLLAGKLMKHVPPPKG